MEELEETRVEGPYDHPVIATLIGVAMLVIGALILPRLLPQQPLATLLGGGAVLALVLWAIGYAATTRHSAMQWKLGSLAVLVIAGVGAAAIAHSQYETIARADASSFAEIEFGPTGAPQVPAGALSRGPLSRLFAQNAAADAQAQRDYDAAFGKLGVANLNSPYLLERAPEILADCGAVDGVGKLAQSQAAAHAERSAAIARALEAANLPARAKQGIATMAGASRSEDPLLANRTAMVDATGALCRLLAKRGWFNNGGYFGFHSAGDEARFRDLSKRRMAIAGETARIEKAAQQRMAQGRDQVREALSRSIFSGG